MSGHRIASALILSLCFLTASGRWSAGAGGPTYEVDPAWPKPLPNHWIVGAVAGVAVDSRDHVWIVHRPSTLQPNETRSIWRAAPPVLEFDGDGTLLSSWGGPSNQVPVAAARTRHLCGRGRSRMAWRRRRARRADSEVHARWTVPAANRPSGRGPREQRYREPGRRFANGRRRGGTRTVRRRRLREPSRHRVRFDQRRLQATLGRLRQAP